MIVSKSLGRSVTVRDISRRVSSKIASVFILQSRELEWDSSFNWMASMAAWLALIESFVALMDVSTFVRISLSSTVLGVEEGLESMETLESGVDLDWSADVEERVLGAMMNTWRILRL